MQLSKFNLLLLGFLFSLVAITSCSKDEDNTPEPLPIPSSLQSTDNLFYPEDITIVNNTAYVSSFADAKIWSFDLTQSTPTGAVFAQGEAGFAQAWGLTSDGNVLLSLLNNADFTGGAPGPSKLVEYNLATGAKTREWALPVNSVGHTVSIVNGKYYVGDFGTPRIFEVDPASGNVNDSWFTSPQWDPAISGMGGIIYDNEGGFYISQGNKLWYLPISSGTPGTLQEVTVNGLTTIDADGISWDDTNNTLYYATNDTGDPANLGEAFKLVFSNKTTATGSSLINGLNDTSGVWFLNDNGNKYLFVCESQFGALFGFNALVSPFNIQVVNL